MAKYKKRADGRYYTRIFLGREENGNKKYKNLYARSEPELSKLEADVRSKLQRGFDVLKLTDTFNQWFKRLQPAKEAALTTAEYNTFKSRVEYFSASVGDLPLRDVTQTQLQPCLLALSKCNPHTGKPTARRTLQRYLNAVSEVFEYAIANRAAEFNPCRYVVIPKDAPQKERRALSEEERRRIVEFPHRAQPAAMLLMYSGLRRGEATALLWSDVDLKNRTILVNKSYDFKNCELKTPKTEAGTRLVSIPKRLCDYLATLEHKSIYVLTSANGKMMTDTAWKRLWDSYLCDLNLAYGVSLEKRHKFDPKGQIRTIEEFTPHCLRHTFCTIMYFSGVDVLTARDQMGHSDIRTTLEIYTHLDKIYKKKNIRKLDRYLNTGERLEKNDQKTAHN